MKKLFSLALALALCLSLSLPASAYSSGTLNEYFTVSCGFSHTAAVDADGTLWAWGDNYDGQLGNGKRGTEESTNVPIKIMDGVVSVSCGRRRTAAVKADGSLWTWGFNNYGDLGIGRVGNDIDGNIVYQTVPAKVMDNVAAVCCSDHFTLVLKTDGTVWAWGAASSAIGNNGEWDLAVGIGRYQSTPVKVLDDVVSISCGGGTSAAIRSDGTLWMWGSTIYTWFGGTAGELQDLAVPTKVMDNVEHVSCGGGFTAVLKSDGSLWMWGENSNGELGNGRTGDDCADYGNAGSTVRQTYPVKIMDHVASVVCGSSQTAAIKTDGSLWMWGRNEFGQVGNGTSENANSPVKIMDGVSSVSCSFSQTAAVKADGSLWMWGRNNRGQIGNGGIGNAADPKDYPLRIQTVPVKIMDGVAVGSVNTSPTVAGFSDVRESHYYAEAVKWAVERKVTDGTSDTTFSPFDAVTRAQAVTFLWRAAGTPEPASASSPFDDVSDRSAYYYNAVLWAAENGITDGVSETAFGLNGTLTYDQILTFLCRASGGEAAGADWSAAAVNWAKENGLTDGLTFAPKDSCPRSDVVYCLWKQLG